MFDFVIEHHEFAIVKGDLLPKQSLCLLGGVREVGDDDRLEVLLIDMTRDLRPYLSGDQTTFDLRKRASLKGACKEVVDHR